VLTAVRTSSQSHVYPENFLCNFFRGGGGERGGREGDGDRERERERDVGWLEHLLEWRLPWLRMWPYIYKQKFTDVSVGITAFIFWTQNQIWTTWRRINIVTTPRTPNFENVEPYDWVRPDGEGNVLNWRTTDCIMISHDTDCIMTSHDTDCIMISHDTDCIMISHDTDCIMISHDTECIMILSPLPV
jgi:hypothetical protein